MTYLSPNQGLVFAFISAAAFALMGFSGAGTAGSAVATVVLLRSIVLLALSTAGGGVRLYSLRSLALRILVARGIFDTIGIVLWIFALSYVPASTSLAILMLAPLIAGFLSAIQGMGALSKRHLYASGGAFVGIVLIVGPELDGQVIGLSACILSMISLVFSITIGRKLAGMVSPPTVTFYSAAISVVALAPGSSFAIPIDVAIASILMGFFAFTGNYFLQRSFVSGLHQSIIMTIYYVQIPLLSVLEVIFYKNKISASEISGLLLFTISLAASIQSARKIADV